MLTAIWWGSGLVSALYNKVRCRQAFSVQPVLRDGAVKTGTTFLCYVAEVIPYLH